MTREHSYLEQAMDRVDDFLWFSDAQDTYNDTFKFDNRSEFISMQNYLNKKLPKSSVSYVYTADSEITNTNGVEGFEGTIKVSLVATKFRVG